MAIGQLETVLDRLKNIEEAESIAVTTGEYDIVLRIKVSSLEELYRVTIEKIHKINGIVNTLTHIIEKEL